MFKRIVKGFLIVLILLLVVLVIALASINRIINSKHFKGYLNKKLASSKVHINYQRATLKLTEGSLWIRDLAVTKGKSVNASISSIYIYNLYHPKSLGVRANNGKIAVLSIKRKKTPSQEKKLSIPFLPQVELKNIAVQYLNHRINVAEATIAQDKSGFIKITSDFLKLNGKAEWKTNTVKIDLFNLFVETSKLTNLLSQITKVPNLPILHQPASVRVDKANIKFNSQKKTLEILVNSRIGIKTANESFLLNDKGQTTAFLKLTFDFKNHNIGINLSKVRGNLTKLKKITPLFTKPKVLTKTVFPIIGSGTLNNGSFSILLSKGHLKQITINGDIENVTAYIPKTRLTVYEAYGHVSLKDKLLNIKLSHANCEGLNLQKSKVSIKNI